MITRTLPKGYIRTDTRLDGLYHKREKVHFYALCLACILTVDILYLFLFSQQERLQSGWLPLMLLPLVVILHEVLHFLPLRLRGMKPHFVYVSVPGYGRCPGVLPSGGYFSRQEYLVCLLLPQAITAIGIFWLLVARSISPVNIYLSLFWAVIANLLGGVADISAVIGVLRKDKQSTLYLSNLNRPLATEVYNLEVSD